MKLLTRDTDYAVRALCCMHKRRGVVVSVSRLVQDLKVPKPFLRKILQVLHKEGIVRAYKGKGGGFLVSGDAGKIGVLDLIKIFQGSLKLNECLFKKKACPNKRTCALRSKIVTIEAHVRSQLRPITIASLVRREKS